MTSDYLLDAIGLLDDDLIWEAEQPAASKPFAWQRMRRYSALAASLVLVVALGYGVSHMGMGGAGSAGGTASTSSNAQADAADSQENGSAPAASGPDPEAYLLDGTFALTGTVVDALPQGSQLLGSIAHSSQILLPSVESAQLPSLQIEDYVECSLWVDKAEQIYLQLPLGGYALAERVQP